MTLGRVAAIKFLVDVKERGGGGCLALRFSGRQAGTKRICRRPQIWFLITKSPLSHP